MTRDYCAENQRLRAALERILQLADRHPTEPDTLYLRAVANYGHEGAEHAMLTQCFFTAREALQD